MMEVIQGSMEISNGTGGWGGGSAHCSKCGMGEAKPPSLWRTLKVREYFVISWNFSWVDCQMVLSKRGPIFVCLG